MAQELTAHRFWELDEIRTDAIVGSLYYLKDEVDAVLAEKDAENRRLKRALWLARAWYCGRSSEYFSGMASRCKIGQEYFYREVNERARRYMQSSYKCRAKAEEYK